MKKTLLPLTLIVQSLIIICCAKSPLNEVTAVYYFNGTVYYQGEATGNIRVNLAYADFWGSRSQHVIWMDDRTTRTDTNGEFQFKIIDKTEAGLLFEHTYRWKIRVLHPGTGLWTKWVFAENLVPSGISNAGFIFINLE